MQAQRIKFLQDEIENFPEDPFNYYALAMEYVSAGNPGARDLFEKLLKDFPTYLPTYYQAANYFFNAEEYVQADAVFRSGIALAQTQENAKAYKELSASYALFKSETEDEL